jgi:hypothetical protein
MTQAGYWKTDWFLGIAVDISVALLFNRSSDFIPSLRRKETGDEIATALRAAFTGGAWQAGRRPRP